MPTGLSPARTLRRAPIPTIRAPIFVPIAVRVKRRQNHPVFDAMAHYLDYSVGRILEKLEDEGGIRVPMIVRWPSRVAAGTVNQTLFNTPDLYPTLLDLAGLDMRPELADSLARKLDT